VPSDVAHAEGVYAAAAWGCSVRTYVTTLRTDSSRSQSSLPATRRLAISPCLGGPAGRPHRAEDPRTARTRMHRYNWRKCVRWQQRVAVAREAGGTPAVMHATSPRDGCQAL
jgi:hypothetical protein